jgi:hypothetical protein
MWVIEIWGFLRSLRIVLMFLDIEESLKFQGFHKESKNQIMLKVSGS